MIDKVVEEWLKEKKKKNIGWKGGELIQGEEIKGIGLDGIKM